MTAPSIRRYQAFRMHTRKEPQLQLPEGMILRPTVEPEKIPEETKKKDPPSNAIQRDGICINEEDAIAGPQQLLMMLDH